MGIWSSEHAESGTDGSDTQPFILQYNSNNNRTKDGAQFPNSMELHSYLGIAIAPVTPTKFSYFVVLFVLFFGERAQISNFGHFHELCATCHHKRQDPGRPRKYWYFNAFYHWPTNVVLLPHVIYNS